MNEIGLDRITPSGLVLYEKCPKSFYYSVFLGIRLPQPMIHLEFGTAMHLAIDNIYEQWNEEDGWTLADKKIVKDIFKRRFTIDAVDIEHFKDKREQVYNEMLEDGLAIIDEYWDQKEILRAKGINPTVFEIPLKTKLHIPGCEEPMELPISLRIDGINEPEDKITEFKTSSKKYDYNETRSSLQALSYAAARYCQTGRIPSVDYVVMLKKIKKDKIQHISIQYQVADLLEYDRRVRAILEKIRNREFNRPMKGHDIFCDCYKYEELLKIEK